MKKHLLLYLFLGICIITSCTKTQSDVTENNVAQNNVFVPVTLFGSPGNWGGSVCSWGFVMVRKDTTSIVYHSVALPANSNITNTPVSVSILFHDTIQISSCWREIVVDSIKH